MKKPLPHISVIIPTMNRQRLLEKSLYSLKALDYPKSFVEIIVIDNNSSDKTRELIQTKFPQVKIIHNTKNLGFAPALNQGILASTKELIFITNDDVVFEKKSLSELVKVMTQEEKIAIVGGKMLFSNNPSSMALQGFKVNKWLGYHPYDFSHKDLIREMDIATGGCMLLRKSIVKKIGLFDPDFFFCGEDYDLCFRIKYAGYKIMYAPYAIIWHAFLNSGKKTNNFDQLFAHYRGKFRFMFIHGSLLQLFVFLPFQFFVGPIYSYLTSKQLTLLPMTKAFFFNLRMVPSIVRARQKVSVLKQNGIIHKNV